MGHNMKMKRRLWTKEQKGLCLTFDAILNYDKTMEVVIGIRLGI
jgi:hypothetical protein